MGKDTTLVLMVALMLLITANYHIGKQQKDKEKMMISYSLSIICLILSISLWVKLIYEYMQ